jgi:DNA repair protein RadA
MKGAVTKYVCTECGREESKWMGRCPSCGAWNSFIEDTVLPATKSDVDLPVMDDKVRPLSSIEVDEQIMLKSGISEFDRVLGGGIMRPSSVLVGGEPGIGKSTLMLQVLSAISAENKVLYVSGEESPSQVKLRAIRLGLNLDGISIFCDTRIEAVEKAVEKIKPALVVVDSLQTLSSASVPSIAGSPTQVKTCSLALTLLAKRENFALFLVGHITKEGAIAGPKIIEHMVDTVLYFEQTSDSAVRFLRASKNRFGSVDELGIFKMEDKGLIPVPDPSAFFISSREEGKLPSGIAFSGVSEGSRTFLVEIQALTVPAKSGLSRIYSDKIDIARVSRVAAILERHAGLKLTDQDIYVNIAGGMKAKEVAIELPLALALFSALTQKPLPEKLVTFGELSLAGEVRPVSGLEKRLRPA